MDRDSAIAELAAGQHGVVSRAQLLAAGIGPNAINTRLRHQRLHRLHQGVYVVGHTALAPLAAETAAVLACGPNALLSHRTAARLWGLLEGATERIELTVPRAARRRPGLWVHRSRSLGHADARVHHGLPVTSPERTLLDVAEVAAFREVERAFDEAVTLRLATHSSIAAAVERSQGRHGACRVQALLARDEEPAFTRSEAEERLLALIRGAGLPTPEVNVRLGAHRVDFLWRESRLVVEADGYRFHSSPAAFERDRLRDADLTAAGLRVVRVTWRQLSEAPLAVVARLAQALAG